MFRLAPHSGMPAAASSQRTLPAPGFAAWPAAFRYGLSELASSQRTLPAPGFAAWPAAFHYGLSELAPVPRVRAALAAHARQAGMAPRLNAAQPVRTATQAARGRVRVPEPASAAALAAGFVARIAESPGPAALAMSRPTPIGKDHQSSVPPQPATGRHAASKPAAVGAPAAIAPRPSPRRPGPMLGMLARHHASGRIPPARPATGTTWQHRAHGPRAGLPHADLPTPEEARPRASIFAFPAPDPQAGHDSLAAPGLAPAHAAPGAPRLLFRITPPARLGVAEREAQVREVERRVHVALAGEAERTRVNAPAAGGQTLSTLLSPAMLDELAQRVYAENRRRGAIERYRKGA
jgi:hypothetical protein